MSDQLLVTVTPSRLQVEAGGSAEVTLQIQNHSAVVDEYVVEPLGEAAAWISIERPQVSIFPDGAESVQVSIRPPRASYPEAGVIPVGFRVRSTVNPELAVVEECQIDLQPFVEIGGEVAPKTARGRFSATHRLRVLNKGNAPVKVAVRAEVQQGDVQFGLPESALQVAAGQRATTKVKVRPSNSRWQGSEEMHQYRLTLEPQGGGAPLGIDANMRQQPILKIPLVALLAVALLIGAGAYTVYGKGPNPIRMALRWTGVVDVGPSAEPSPEAPSTVAANPGQHSAAPPPTTAPATVSAHTPTPSVPSPSPPTPPPSPPQHIVTATNPTFITAPPAYFNPQYLTCTNLTTVTLTDVPNAVTGARTLTWKGNGNCGPFSGTLTATYGTWVVYPCGFSTICKKIATQSYPHTITGVSGTYVDSPPAGVVSVSYSISLKDGNGYTATATAT